MWKIIKDKFSASLLPYRHIAPLAVFRMAFGAIMLISTIRFMLRGWIADFYITPQFHFTFYGFEWIKPMGAAGMYAVFILMALASLLILLGLFYRISIVLFFISFCYVELIDKTYYLNHYYFISIITFLLMLVPANRYFSLDVKRKPSLEVTQVPSWTITIFKFQLLLVYFFAGVSKINHDWLLDAMPLKIWLPANGNLPVIGHFLQQEWVAYFFSWFGALFDLFIVFFLLNKFTRTVAYFVVILFHVFTAWFFKIGMFPYIMILVTIIFFSEDFHIRLIEKIRYLFNRSKNNADKLSDDSIFLNIPSRKKKIIYVVLGIYFFLQIVIPFRYLLYPGKLLWTEEGYRFSWRVMLMEKGGTTFFHVKDPATGRSSEIINSRYLTPFQEKMMETQPDMILEYAHYLKDEYIKKGIAHPVVTVESYVTLNGSGSKPFIDSHVDLSKEEDGFSVKTWILPFYKN
jgi:hypothetical protein